MRPVKLSVNNKISEKMVLFVSSNNVNVSNWTWYNLLIVNYTKPPFNYNIGSFCRWALMATLRTRSWFGNIQLSLRLPNSQDTPTECSTWSVCCHVMSCKWEKTGSVCQNIWQIHELYFFLFFISGHVPGWWGYSHRSWRWDPTLLERIQ